MLVEKHHSYDLTQIIKLSNCSNDFVANMIGVFIRKSADTIAKIEND